MVRFALALSTLGVGYSPVAPGTFGSVLGLLLWSLLPASAPAQLTAVIVVFLVGAWSGSIAERHFNRTDPRPVVIDEVLGMLITLLFNPVGWQGAVIGFAFFRIADIVKPYPSNRLESLHGGFGIMADDGMAAVYANLALRATILLFARAWNWAL
jgi:phosphatidylglycerophosphatase A